MSKMFDALRWAEEQRRKLTTRIQDVGVTPTSSGSERRFLDVTTLPTGLVKELGMLRNSLEVIFRGRDTRSILFTSASHGEGSTTVATNFARFLSMEGMKRTLTIEMNARRPAFADVFSINGDAGITDYFTGQRELNSLVRVPEASDLPVIHVGRPDPTVIQLHLKNVFPRFLRDAHQHYETVIIDAPPVVSSPETPQMAALVDGVVLVLHAGKTKREVAMRALKAIEQFDGNVVGVVLNRKRYYIPEFIYKRI